LSFEVKWEALNVDAKILTNRKIAYGKSKHNIRKELIDAVHHGNNYL
jgi:hypothetical protein